MEYREDAKRVSKKLTVRDVLEEGNRNFIRMMEAKAMDRGMEKGMEREKEQTAKNLIKENMDDDFISKVTGLSKKKISSFRF